MTKSLAFVIAGLLLAVCLPTEWVVELWKFCEEKQLFSSVPPVPDEDKPDTVKKIRMFGEYMTDTMFREGRIWFGRPQQLEMPNDAASWSIAERLRASRQDLSERFDLEQLSNDMKQDVFAFQHQKVKAYHQVSVKRSKWDNLVALWHTTLAMDDDLKSELLVMPWFSEDDTTVLTHTDNLVSSNSSILERDFALHAKTDVTGGTVVVGKFFSKTRLDNTLVDYAFLYYTVEFGVKGELIKTCQPTGALWWEGLFCEDILSGDRLLSTKDLEKYEAYWQHRSVDALLGEVATMSFKQDSQDV